MDLAKLISMLEHSALYFPRVDTLAASDPFEGYYTNINAAVAKLTFESTPDEVKQAIGLVDKKLFDIVIGHMRSSGQVAKSMRERTYVSSWHVLPHESAAMWALYLRSQDGIAVRTTYQSLVEAFAPCTAFPIHVGLIRYIDYEVDAIPAYQALLPMMHKRKSFEHEQELRALIWTIEVEGKQGKKVDMLDNSNSEYRDKAGLYVKVNLDKLIDKIFVAPSAPQWIVDVVAALLAKYGVKKDVQHSPLAARPLF